jgi:hypothetical protein
LTLIEYKILHVRIILFALSIDNTIHIRVIQYYNIDYVLVTLTFSSQFIWNSIETSMNIIYKYIWNAWGVVIHITLGYTWEQTYEKRYYI